MIKDIAKRSDVTETQVKKLLNNKYNPRDIIIVDRLAKTSGKKIQSVLDMIN